MRVLNKRSRVFIAIDLVIAMIAILICVHPKSVSARSLTGEDMLRLHLYEQMANDAADGQVLQNALIDRDVAAVSNWLSDTVDEFKDYYGIEEDTSSAFTTIQDTIEQLTLDGYFTVGSDGSLTELSKTYLINSALECLGSVTDLSSLKISKKFYKQIAEKDVNSKDIREQLEKISPELPNSVLAQLDAIDTLALSLQYQLSENNNEIAWTDKFYAINQLETYLDVLYSDKEGYENVKESIEGLKEALAAAAPDGVISDTVNQMNDVQDVLSSGVQAEAPEYDVEIEDSIVGAMNDTQDRYNSMLTPVTSNSTEPTETDESAENNTSYALTISAEDLQTMQSQIVDNADSIEQLLKKYETLRLQATNDLRSLQEEIDDIYDQDDYIVAEIKNLRTSVRNDLITTNEDMQAADDALNERVDTEEQARQDAITAEAKARQDADTAESKTRQDADTAESKARQDADTAESKARQDADTAESKARDTAIQNETTNRTNAVNSEASARSNADNALSGRVSTIESQDVVTVMQNITINVSGGTYYWHASGGTYYCDISSSAIIPGCAIDIKYKGDPGITPTYTVNESSHYLRITVPTAIATTISYLTIYSKVNA